MPGGKYESGRISDYLIMYYKCTINASNERPDLLA